MPKVMQVFFSKILIRVLYLLSRHSVCVKYDDLVWILSFYRYLPLFCDQINDDTEIPRHGT